jgi:hypothetical protein
MGKQKPGGSIGAPGAETQRAEIDSAFDQTVLSGFGS